MGFGDYSGSNPGDPPQQDNSLSTDLSPLQRGNEMPVLRSTCSCMTPPIVFAHHCDSVAAGGDGYIRHTVGETLDALKDR